MKQANQRRVVTTINVFAIITGIIAFGHGYIIDNLIQLGKEEDKLDPRFHDLAFWVKVPFIVGICIFALLQLFASVSILILNARNHSTRSIYYSSIIGMLSAFAVGVYYTLEASQYNANTRNYPKTGEDPLPHIMFTYWSLQMGASSLLLIVFPMFSFIFYHKLEKYLYLQRQERTEKVGGSDLQGWCLSLFLLQALSNIGNIINLYQYSAAQDNQNYAMDNAVDVYAFYLASATLLSVVAIALQLKNLLNNFLSKKQVILLAVMVGLFQIGVLFLVAIKLSEGFVELGIMGEELCEFQDCEAERLLRWEYLAYTAIGLLSVLVQIPYLKMVSYSVETNQQRDTLMTTEEAIES